MMPAVLRTIIVIVLWLLIVPAFSQSRKPSGQNKKKTRMVKKGTVPAKKGGTAAPAAAKKSGTTAPKKKEVLPPPPDVRPIGPTVNANSRDHKETSLKAYNSPFRKGTFSSINRATLDYTKFKDEPGIDATSSDLELRGDLNYFVLDGLAIGIEGRYGTSTTHMGWESKLRSWSAYLNLSYGMSVTPWLNVYARIGGGPSHSYSGQNIAAGHGPLTELNSDFFDIHGGVGFPIAVSRDNPVFFTPYLNYDHVKGDASNHHIVDKTFSFGIRVESYMNCKAMRGTGREWQHTQPRKGMSFFEFNTMGSLSFSTREESQGPVKFGDVKRNTGTFGIGYNYYILDYLAAGLNLELYSYSIKNGGATDKISSWMVQPMVTVNAPVEGALHNLFFQIGYGWEREKLYGNKERNSYFPLRLGYNLFITKNICFSPKIGYERNVSNHVTAGGEYKESGLVAELGIRGWFDFGWFD